MLKGFDNLIVHGDDILETAMRKMDISTMAIVYVADDDGHLLGSITDGDVRRWILKGGNAGDRISEMMHKSTISSHDNDRNHNLALMRKHKLNSVPILNDDGIIIDIQFEEWLQRGIAAHTPDLRLKETTVIVMAGGEGTRLQPYTKILPKPLIPIGDKPILERVFDKFHEFGVDGFYVTVNYKKEMIKSYFMESLSPYYIKYIDETEPLGTAGGISLINEDFDGPIFITNCDVFIDVDYGDILNQHIEQENDLTIISSLKNVQVSYGVIYPDEEGRIKSMEEKPRTSYYINTGMYVLNPEYVSWIPKNKMYHMTELADEMIKQKRKVGMYAIAEGSFFDMGEFDEMKRMEEYMAGGYYN